MKQVTKLVAVAAVAAVVGWGYQANAMTVNWGDTGSPFLTAADGVTPLAIGDLIEIGSDTANTSGGFTLWTAGANIATPSLPGGTGLIGDGTGAEGSFSEGNGGAGAGFFSDQIYIKAFNSSSANGAYSLFTSTTWVFPATDAGTENLDLGNGGITVLVGSYFTGTVTDPNLTGGGPNADAIAVAVPEPSSIALVVLGLLGGIGLIRRRS